MIAARYLCALLLLIYTTASIAYNSDVSPLRAKTRAKLEKLVPDRAHPKVSKLYDNLAQEVKNKNLNKDDMAGTKLALKKLARQFQDQFLSIMWGFASRGSREAQENQSLSDAIYGSEFENAVITAGSGPDDTELGDIGEGVYEDLLESVRRNNGDHENGDNEGRKSDDTKKSARSYKKAVVFDEKMQKNARKREQSF